MCVKFYLNRYRFPLIIAKCLGKGSLFCGQYIVSIKYSVDSVRGPY